MRFATLITLTCLFTLCGANADATLVGAGAQPQHELRSHVKLQPRQHFSLNRLEKILAKEISSLSIDDFFVRDWGVRDTDTMLVLGKKRGNKVNQQARGRRKKTRKRKRKRSRADDDDDDDGGDDDD